MNQSALEQHLVDLGLSTINFYDQVDSTNLEAARSLEKGAPDRSLVAADEQTAGRGRAGRQWFTYPGSALAFSLLLTHFPAYIHASPAFLTGLCAVSVAHAIGNYMNSSVQIKWPNDVLINGRKVCGILVDMHWQGDQLQAAILGMGINISHAAIPPAQVLAFPATSLEDELGMPVDRLELLHAVLANLLGWLSGNQSTRLLETWENYLTYRCEWVVVRQGLLTGINPANQEMVSGRLLGLDNSGRLRLADATGKIISLDSGDLRLRLMD